MPPDAQAPTSTSDEVCSLSNFAPMYAFPSVIEISPLTVRRLCENFTDDVSTSTSTGPRDNPSQLPGSSSSNSHITKLKRSSVLSRTMPARRPSISIIKRCFAALDSRVVLKSPTGVRLSRRDGARSVVGANRTVIILCCPHAEAPSSKGAASVRKVAGGQACYAEGLSDADTLISHGVLNGAWVDMLPNFVGPYSQSFALNPACRD